MPIYKPTSLPSSQKWLLERMKSLGYPVNQRGMCYGISYMALHAFLLKQFTLFQNRLKKIEQLSLHSFKSEMEKLSPEEKLELLAFFDGIVAYQYPSQFQKMLYPQQPFLGQIKNVSMPLLLPAPLESAKNTVGELPYQLVCGYYSQRDLEMLISCLFLHIKDSVTLMINNPEHIVCLHYCPQTFEWFFFDPNDMSGKNFFSMYQANQLAKCIIEAFCFERCVLGIRLYGLSEEQFQLIAKDKYWQSIHTVHETHFKEKDDNGFTLAHILCQLGDREKIEHVASQYDLQAINVASDNDDLPFSLACFNGHVDIIKIFLAHFNRTSTPLSQAKLLLNEVHLLRLLIKTGHPELIELSTGKIKKTIEQSEPECKALFPILFDVCLPFKNTNFLMEWLKRLMHKVDIDVLKKANRQGKTYLYRACEIGNRFLVEMLVAILGQQAIIKQLHLKHSPINIAYHQGHNQLAHFLMSKLTHHHLSHPFVLKRLPLDLACEKKDQKTVLILAQLIKSKKPWLNKVFFKACEYGLFDVVKTLMTELNDEQISAPNLSQVTPFWISCYWGRYIIVQQLLGRLSINAITKTTLDGVSALHIAIQQGHFNIALKLIDIWPKNELNAVTSNGLSPLWIACAKGYDVIVERLLQRLSADDLNQANEDGISPLWIACEQGHAKVVQLLIHKLGPRLAANRKKIYVPYDSTVPSIFIRDDYGVPNLFERIKPMGIKTLTQGSDSEDEANINNTLTSETTADSPFSMHVLESELMITCLRKNIGVLKVLLSSPHIKSQFWQKSASGVLPFEFALKKPNLYIVPYFFQSVILKDIINSVDMKYTLETLGKIGPIFFYKSINRVIADKQYMVLRSLLQFGEESGYLSTNLNSNHLEPLITAIHHFDAYALHVLVCFKSLRTVNRIKKALELACTHGDKIMVRILLNRISSYELNRANASKKNLLLIACEAGKNGIVKLLLKKGIEIGCNTPNKENPVLTIAKKQNNKELLFMLCQALEDERKLKRKSKRYLKSTSNSDVFLKAQGVLEHYLKLKNKLTLFQRKKNVADAPRAISLLKKIKEAKTLSSLDFIINQELKDYKLEKGKAHANYANRYYRHLVTLQGLIDNEQANTKATCFNLGATSMISYQ